jgi:serine/threonine protein kinase
MQEVYPPSSFAAPEVQLHDVLTPACDVWSLGCIIFHLFSPRRDFWIPGFELRRRPPRDTLLDLSLAYDKLPEHWWDMWKHRDLYFVLERDQS